MRYATLALVLAAAPGLAACATADTVPPPSAAYPEPPPSRLVETPHTAPPAHDIPESKRREWLDAQHAERPRPYRPARVERVIVREPVHHEHDRDYDRRLYWAVPFALTLGWWGGHHHDHGWGWGVRWGGGWWW